VIAISALPHYVVDVDNLELSKNYASKVQRSQIKAKGALAALENYIAATL